jgi:hypothetical protein
MLNADLDTLLPGEPTMGGQVARPAGADVRGAGARKRLAAARQRHVAGFCALGAA